MRVEDKSKSLNDAMQKLDKLPITLPLSEAERLVLSQWIGKALTVAYDTGFEDGQRK